MLKLRTILVHQDARQLRILGHMVKVKAENSYSIEVIDSCSDSSKLYQSIFRNAPSLLLMEESLFTPCINALSEKCEVILITGDRSKVDVENVHYVYLPVQPVTIMKKISELVDTSSLLRDVQGPKAFLNSLHFPNEYSSAVDFYVESQHLTWQFGINYVEQRSQIYAGLQRGEFSPSDKEQDHADTTFDPASIINPALRGLWDGGSTQQSGYNPNPTPAPRAPARPTAVPPAPTETPPVPVSQEPAAPAEAASEPSPMPPADPPAWAIQESEPEEEPQAAPVPDNRWVKPAAPPPPVQEEEPVEPVPVSATPSAETSPPPPAKTQSPAAPVSGGHLPAPPTPEELAQMMQMMQNGDTPAAQDSAQKQEDVPQPSSDEPVAEAASSSEDNLTKFTFINPKKPDDSSPPVQEPLVQKPAVEPVEPEPPVQEEPAPMTNPWVKPAAPPEPAFVASAPVPAPPPVPTPVPEPLVAKDPLATPFKPVTKGKAAQTTPLKRPKKKLEPLPPDIPNPGDVVNMEWEHFPEKTSYFLGEIPDILDGIVAAIHADGTRELVSLQNEMLRNVRYTVGEEQMGSVLIYGFALQIPMHYSKEKRLVGIRISSSPRKCIYREGEHLDLDGFSMEKLFSDKSVVPLTDYKYDDKPLELGQPVVVFRYGRRTANLLIQVLPLHAEEPVLPDLSALLAASAPSVKRVELLAKPKTKYGVGDPFDPGMGSLRVVYDDGTDETIPLDESMVTDWDTSSVGNREITLSYHDKSCTLLIQVVRKKKKKSKPVERDVPVSAVQVSANPVQEPMIQGQAEPTVQERPADTGSEVVPEMIPDVAHQVVQADPPHPVEQEQEEPVMPEPQKELVRVTIAGQPKTTFILGERVPLPLYQLRADYSDGTSQMVTAEAVDPIVIEENTSVLVFSYLGKTAELPVAVSGKQLMAIMLDAQPAKLEYVLGERQVDMTGAKATLFYSDNSYESVDIPDEWVSGFDGSKAGKQNLKISYQGKEAAFTVTVADRAVETINIVKMPMKIKYHEGESFDPSGMEVSVKYNDGYFGERAPFSYDKVPLKAGDNHVTIYVGEKTAAVFVEVTASTISRIAMEALPIKTVYLEGERELDPAGALVAKFASTGEKEIVPLSTCQYTGFSSLKAGNCRILVTANGCTCEFEVSIMRRELTSLRIAAMPVKTIYNDGDIFDPTGLVLAAEYNDGTASNITNYVVDSKVLTLGDTEVKAQFETMTVTIPVSVQGRQIDSIVIAQMPNKTSYLEHQEQLDMTGGRLMVIYADGDSSVIDITNSMVTGFNNTIAGENVVTIHYCNATVEMSLQIASAQLIGISIQKNPDRITYEVGEFFDKTGMEVVAFFNNGQKQLLSYYSILPETPLTANDTAVQIMYMNKSATLPITVQANTDPVSTTLPSMDGFYPDTEDLRFTDDDEDDED